MDLRDAIEGAKRFVGIAYADEDIGTLRTEQIEFDPGRNAWLVTLGLMRPAVDTRAGQVATLLGNPVMKRSYEVFVVHAASGEVDAMRVKQFDE